MLPLKKIHSVLLEHIKNNSNSFNSFNIYFQDESRIGLFTRNGKSLTARGVKPVCLYHHKFENRYLFGAFSPITGDAIMLDLPNCDTDMFQLHLTQIARHKPDEFKIIFLDNGAFHKAKRLIIPRNIQLVFLPPYSPELNPAEKIWWVIKKELTNKLLKTIPALQKEVTNIIYKKLTPQQVISITAFDIYLHPFKTILNF